MADRIYLHIGAAKTGTSYLQRTMWRNQDRLEEQGIFLPLGRRRAHFDAVADMRGGIWADGVLTASWDELVAEVKSRPGTALVSEELLCGATTEQIQGVVDSLAPVEVHVIHAARDIGRQVPAEWQQGLRARSVMGYEEWLRRLRDEPDRPFWNIQDPVQVHQRWGPALEPGRFHLMTVPGRGSGPTVLWDRFCSIFGADPEQATFLEATQNESLGVVESELLRRFNAQLGPLFPMRHPYIKVVRDHLMRPALQGAPDAVRIGVPAGYVDWVVGRAGEMVDQLAALGEEIDVSGSLEDLRAQVEPSTLSPDDVTEAQLLDAALQAWTRQLQAIEVDVDKRNAQRRRRRQARVRQRKHEEKRSRVWHRRLRRRAAGLVRRAR